jgi:hypothetical protein
MSWFRAKRGVVAWLAFFALACQLSFSFGHVHVNKFGLGLAPQAAAQITHLEAAAPSLAPKKDPISIAGDFCAVCSNIAQANALFLSASPHSVLPISIFADLQWLLAAVELASQSRFHFSARGPPSA